jgi:hypothetical protein
MFERKRGHDSIEFNVKIHYLNISYLKMNIAIISVLAF